MTSISQQFHTLGQAIEYASQGHRVNGQNLANVNTPNYQAKELSFQEFISRIEKGHGADTGELEIKNVQGLPVRADGNNVDLERELGMLKKNAMAYQMLTQLLGSKMGIIQRSMT